MSESKDLQWMFEGREPVRAHLDDQGNPWFVAKDVCRVLGISDHFQAVEALEKEEGGRYTIPTPSISGEQEMLVVSEFGLYALIFKSRKEQATAFRRWLSTTVLPEIRKTGGYRIAELQAEVNRLQEEVMLLDRLTRIKATKLKSNRLTKAIEFARGDAQRRADHLGDMELDDAYTTERFEYWVRMLGGLSPIGEDILKHELKRLLVQNQMLEEAKAEAIKAERTKLKALMK